VIIFVMTGFSYAFFKLQNAIMKGGIRPEADIELEGLDIPEMGVLAYPEDAIVTDDGVLEPSNYMRDGTPISI
jgi:Amt family ammonium transporter